MELELCLEQSFSYSPALLLWRAPPRSPRPPNIWFEGNRVELFNLDSDLREEADLAAEESERVSKLRDERHAWQKDVGAKLPLPNPNYDATKPSGRAAKRNPNL